jgi:hypothetical protein
VEKATGELVGIQNIYFTVDDKSNKINITKVEYDKKHIFNNKVFHRRIKHVRT